MRLTEFLVARIAEDEAVAQAVYDEQSRQLAGASIVLPDPREPYAFPVELENGFQVLGVAPFARLAECEAKRRIVELHPIETEPVTRENLNPQWTEDEYRKYLDQHSLVDGGLRYACKSCDLVYDRDYGDWLDFRNGEGCPTLRALALPYVDHPDFCEEWRVEG